MVGTSAHPKRNIHLIIRYKPGICNAQHTTVLKRVNKNERMFTQTDCVFKPYLRRERETHTHTEKKKKSCDVLIASIITNADK